MQIEGEQITGWNRTETTYHKTDPKNPIKITARKDETETKTSRSARKPKRSTDKSSKRNHTFSRASLASPSAISTDNSNKANYRYQRERERQRVNFTRTPRFRGFWFLENKKLEEKNVNGDQPWARGYVFIAALSLSPVRGVMWSAAIGADQAMWINGSGVTSAVKEGVSTSRWRSMSVAASRLSFRRKEVISLGVWGQSGYFNRRI